MWFEWHSTKACTCFSLLRLNFLYSCHATVALAIASFATDLCGSNAKRCPIATRMARVNNAMLDSRTMLSTRAGWPCLATKFKIIRLINYF